MASRKVRFADAVAALPSDLPSAFGDQLTVVPRESPFQSTFEQMPSVSTNPAFKPNVSYSTGRRELPTFDEMLQDQSSDMPTGYRSGIAKNQTKYPDIETAALTLERRPSSGVTLLPEKALTLIDGLVFFAKEFTKAVDDVEAKSKSQIDS